MSAFDYDLCVIGGGIIGAAVARDAAGRGLRVYLAERGDFAGGTSSASSKLIHGGLRYLETYEFRMVREGLLERAVLRVMAPHLVRPMKFLVPIARDSPRPAWMVRLGLWLYDFLSGSKKFARSGGLSTVEMQAVPGLKPGRFSKVLHYTDGWGDDARLTLELVRDAAARGANVGNYRAVTALVPLADGYHVHVAEKYPARDMSITTRCIVNAAGPYANHVLDLVEGGIAKTHALRWVRGSHIVVPKEPGLKIDHALTVQRPDKRVVFIYPWLEKYLVVGTTDIEQTQDAPVEISAEERRYLLDAYNDFCIPARTDEDIVYSWAGVRPLVDDGKANASKVSRDFTFASHAQGQGGLLTIYGGKLTVHRIIAEHALARLKQDFGLAMPGAWTATSQLPDGARDRQVSGLSDIAFTVQQEFVRTPEDYLFRRTKLGVGMGALAQQAIAQEIDRELMRNMHVTQAAE